mgnify:FL=1
MKTAIYRIRKRQQVTYTDVFETLGLLIAGLLGFVGLLIFSCQLLCLLG